MFANFHARLYWALLASFCLLGLCLTFAQPVYSLPDEPAHWLTANVRVEQLFGREGCVPTVTGGACPRKQICSAIPELHLTCTNDIGLYGGVLTYPGVLLSKLILPRQTETALRQVQGIVLARLLHGLIVALCLWRVGVLAWRTRRLGALTLAALMLSPLLAQQAFAVSSDSAQLAFGLCLFSAVMFWEELSYFDVLLFFLLGYSATGKPTMLPLILPSVLAAHWLAQLDRAEVPGVRDCLRSLLQALKPARRPSVQSSLLWLSFLFSALTIVFALYQDAEGQAGTSSEDNLARVTHLKELRERPGMIFELVSSLRYDPRQAQHWIGPLGWLDLWLAPVLMHSFLRLLRWCMGWELARHALLVYRQRSALRGALGRLGRAAPGALVGLAGPIVNVLFMTALMYVVWTPLGAHGARGVQLRYFFPATMVLIALIWRTLQVVLPVAQPAPDAPASPARARLESWLLVLAPCLVLAFSLPYVTRLFIDISVRYHDPAKYPH